MIFIQFLSSFVTFIICVVATQSTVDIFCKSLSSGNAVSLGQVKYDINLNSTKYISFNADLPTYQSICLGTRNLPDRECFTYLEVGENLPKGTFVLFVDESKEVIDIAFHIGGEEWTTELVDVAQTPRPNMNPVVKQAPKKQQQHQTVKQKVVRTKIVEIDGKETKIEEEVEEEVEEDNRSWIQKNWMWVVIPLVVMMVMTPEEEKKQ